MLAYLGNTYPFCVPLSGKHISLVICVPLPRKHISLVICVPLPRKHISLMICVLLPGKLIVLEICVPGTHIPIDMCSPAWEIAYPWWHVFPYPGKARKHISLVICVPYLPTCELTSEIRHQTINIRRLTSDVWYHTQALEHVSLGFFALWFWGAYFRNFTVCFLSKGAHITRDICFLGRGTRITGEMCFLRREHISLGICFLSRGTHMTRDTVKFRK